MTTGIILLMLLKIISRHNWRIPTPTDYDVNLISDFSLSTHTISAIVEQVPNQPLVFKVDENFSPTKLITF